jgi:hypothetical protein
MVKYCQTGSPIPRCVFRLYIADSQRLTCQYTITSDGLAITTGSIAELPLTCEL